MKNQALFFSKDKHKKLKCRLLQFLFGALRVNRETGKIIPKLSIILCNPAHWKIETHHLCLLLSVSRLLL